MGKYSKYELNYYVKVLLPPMKVEKLYVHLFTLLQNGSSKSVLEDILRRF